MPGCRIMEWQKSSKTHGADHFTETSRTEILKFAGTRSGNAIAKNWLASLGHYMF